MNRKTLTKIGNSLLAVCLIGMMSVGSCYKTQAQVTACKDGKTLKITNANNCYYYIYKTNKNKKNTYSFDNKATNEGYLEIKKNAITIITFSNQIQSKIIIYDDDDKEVILFPIPDCTAETSEKQQVTPIAVTQQESREVDKKVESPEKTTKPQEAVSDAEKKDVVSKNTPPPLPPKKETDNFKEDCKKIESNYETLNTIYKKIFSKKDSLSKEEEELCKAKAKECLGLAKEVEALRQQMGKKEIEYSQKLTAIVDSLDQLRERFLTLVYGAFLNEIAKQYEKEILSKFNILDTIELLIDEAIDNKDYLIRWIGASDYKNALETLKNDSVSIQKANLQFIFNKLDTNEHQEIIELLNDRLIVKFKKIETLQQKLNDFFKIPWLYLSLFAVIIILSLIAILFFINNARKAKKVRIKEEEIRGSIVIEPIPITNSSLENEPTAETHLETGLQDVLTTDSGKYCEIDMLKYHADTRIHKIYFNRECIKQAHHYFSEFAKENPDKETGCFFLGRLGYAENKEQYNITLEKMIEPGDDAKHTEFQVELGGKIMIRLTHEIGTISETTQQEYFLTAWMHSHPGLQLFLSDTDIVCQNDLRIYCHKNCLLAIVIDTKTDLWETALFTPKTNGTMNNQLPTSNGHISFKELGTN